jgi:hypothetical protein
MVQVAIRAPGGVDVVEISGKLDSGADVCAVPEHLVAELVLPPIRAVRAAGFAGVLQEAILYRVDLVISGIALPRVEALTTRRAYAIVGRNVLQRFVLRLDGPRGVFDINLPRGTRPKKRGG